MLLKILNQEKQLIDEAKSKYGEVYTEALNCFNFLSNFIKTYDPKLIPFISFVALIKKNYLLSLLSVVKLQRIQSYSNLRQLIEAVTKASYAISHELKEQNNKLNFTDFDNTKLIHQWIESEYPRHSQFLKEKKDLLNDNFMHCKIDHSINNISISSQNTIYDSFFDREDLRLDKINLFLLIDIAYCALDLFYNSNKHSIVFIDEFEFRLKSLDERKNLILKTLSGF